MSTFTVWVEEGGILLLYEKRITGVRRRTSSYVVRKKDLRPTPLSPPSFLLASGLLPFFFVCGRPPLLYILRLGCTPKGKEKKREAGRKRNSRHTTHTHTHCGVSCRRKKKSGSITALQELDSFQSTVVSFTFTFSVL
jgi:hypothetical protein